MYVGCSNVCEDCGVLCCNVLCYVAQVEVTFVYSQRVSQLSGYRCPCRFLSMIGHVSTKNHFLVLSDMTRSHDGKCFLGN